MFPANIIEWKKKSFWNAGAVPSVVVGCPGELFRYKQPFYLQPSPADRRKYIKEERDIFNTDSHRPFIPLTYHRETYIMEPLGSEYW